MQQQEEEEEEKEKDEDDDDDGPGAWIIGSTALTLPAHQRMKLPSLYDGGQLDQALLVATPELHAPTDLMTGLSARSAVQLSSSLFLGPLPAI